MQLNTYLNRYIIQLKLSLMGNKLALDNCKAFEWQEEFEIIDSNLHDNFLSVRSLTTKDQYLGKQLISVSETETNNIESLITKKINNKSEKVSKLVWSHRIKDVSYCSYQTKFYLAFQKYALNLKEEKIRRQFNGSTFSEEEIAQILNSVVKGLIYLRSLNQPHQRICLQNIFLRQDRTVMLSDPWLFSKEYSSIYTFHLNGFIYPSPQKILYENDMIEGYDPYLSDYYSLGVMILQLIHLEQMDIIYQKGFRRINEETIQKLISKVQSQELRKKLKILLSYDPIPRQFIQKIQIQICNENCIIKSQVKEITANYDNDGRERFLVRRQSQLNKRESYIESFKENQKFNHIEQSKINEFNFPPSTKYSVSHYGGQNHYYGSFFPSAKPPQPPKIVFNNNYSQQYVVPQTIFPQQQQTSIKHISEISRNLPSDPTKSNIHSNDENHYPTKQSEKKQQFNSQGLPTSSISISEQINRIIKSLKGQQDFKPQKNEVQISCHSPQEKHLNFVNYRHQSHSENQNKINMSQNYLSVSDSQMNVKTSFSAQNTPKKNFQEIFSKPESQYTIKIIKNLNSIGHSFKETQSINESFDERSENSVVLGHRFSQKESSMVMKPEHSQQKVTTREQELSTIQEKNINLQTERFQVSSIKDDDNQTDESRNKKTIPEEFHTPDHRPEEKRYNSTIKEVSEDEPSIESVQNDYEEKVLEYAVGTKYIGQTKNGKRWGRGIYYYVDGSYYEGQWKDNKMHGKGSLYYSKGSLAYQGGWYMDTFHGKGRIYNDSPLSINSDQQIDYRHLNNKTIDDYWYIYEGDFFFEQKHGKGKVKLSNGEAYVGEWNEDYIHGRGKFYRLNGEVIQGKWEHGELVEENV